MEKWDLIIYAPAYNVEHSINEFVSRVAKVAKNLRSKNINLQKMIIVNDGSADTTGDKLDTLKNEVAFLRVIHKKRNEGATKALFDGMAAVSKLVQKKNLNRTIVVRMDSDLEHQPEDIPKLIIPIVAGKSKVCVGYIPYDGRSGKDFVAFNKRIGGMESREFVGTHVPQFCPGFNAIRADLFAGLYKHLIFLSCKFCSEYGVEMLTVDFVILALMRAMRENVSVLRLRPIENRYIKKQPLQKLAHYLDYHVRTVEFLRSILAQRPL